MHKKLLLFSFVCLVAAGIVSSTLNTAHSNESGAPTGNTGSPADNKTCAQESCHPGPAQAIAGAITSNVPSGGYVPGNTYTITASVSDPAVVKFGFQISPQSNTGTLLGTMALIDPSTTKFTSASSKYITHKSAGTSFPGHTATWSFSWTAPAAGTGPVTFYGAFNFTNNNDEETGDLIRTSTLTVAESIGVGIDETTAMAAFEVYPNPATDMIHLNYTLQSTNPVAISLYDVTGKKMADLLDETQESGVHARSWSLANYEDGVYVLTLKSGSQSFSRKLVKL